MTKTLNQIYLRRFSHFYGPMAKLADQAKRHKDKQLYLKTSRQAKRK